MNIIDEVRNYYINPAKYPNDKRKIVEPVIERMDEALLELQECAEVQKLCAHYSSERSDASINSVIRQSRADEQGLSATRGYKEIYFNEIIQNANDNTIGDSIDIHVGYEEGEYVLCFCYQDNGFRTENIIGFFNTEIHTKRENMSATGKHGVGIKALFYFVDYLKIESNVIIKFKVDTTEEDGIEKITAVESMLSQNPNWDHKTTTLTIRFPEKNDYGVFHVKKLKDFVLLCQRGNITYSDISKYFFGEYQQQLLFDVRALLFTDKNRNKTCGIKELHFYVNGYSTESFFIKCEKEMGIETDLEKEGNFKIQKENIKFNNDAMLRYLSITHMENDEKEQNFSVAFPLNRDKNMYHGLKCTGRRYYETYYIPEAEKDSRNLNLLINSKYSSVDRTKLTDDDSQEEKILKEIQIKLIKIYRYMVSEVCQTQLSEEYRREISILFHRMLELDNKDFIGICYRNNINNRYLMKYNFSQMQEDGVRFIAYKREMKEAYEKRLLGQKYRKEDCIYLFEKEILQEDTILYDEENYIKDIVGVYNRVFFSKGYLEPEQHHHLSVVLNAVGTLRDLIYYRVRGSLPSEENAQLYDQEVDMWVSQVLRRQEEENISVFRERGVEEWAYIARSIIGRYKLHPHINSIGEIMGASFYEYLFSTKMPKDVSVGYDTFAAKQRSLFDDRYQRLKERLLDLRVNRGVDKEECRVSISKRGRTREYEYQPGEIAFFASWDGRAGCDVYYDDSKCQIIECDDSKEFGAEEFDLLLSKLRDEPNVLENLMSFEGRIMLRDYAYPRWGRLTTYYNHEYLLSTAIWFSSTFINVDFMRRIDTDDWDKYCNYLSFFLTYKKDFKNVPNACYEISAKVNLSVTKLVSVFGFYYSNIEVLNSAGYISQNLTIKLLDVPKQNLCPPDYFEYLKQLIGFEIYVMQTNSVKMTGYEILYIAGEEVKLRYKDDTWWSFAKVYEEQELYSNKERQFKRVIIIHNDRCDWKKAVKISLKELLKNDDILEKCDAFIPENQKLAIHGAEYDKLYNSNELGNLRVQDFGDVLPAREFTCKQLKTLILARGNNDKKCCCCGSAFPEGKELKYGQLIITNNTDEETKEEYPQIVEVVCEKCKQILQKSHKRSRMLRRDDGYYVEYVCLKQNMQEEEKVILKHKLCDGVRKLCAF